MVNILKAPREMCYQLALLSIEVASIFANAPAPVHMQFTHHDSTSPASSSAETTDTGGLRKPIEGDCPICAMEFDATDEIEKVVWCKAACGNNVHERCFQQWAKIKRGQGKTTCVYCRTEWKSDEKMCLVDVKDVVKTGLINEGYVNVAEQLGITGERDLSSYHSYWVARNFSDGYER
jgi:hypothetical protein